MPYLVDGHNLIPKAGLRLDALDDEMDLVSILQEFSRKSRAAVEVYFDGAPVGQAGMRRLGVVTAHFSEVGTTADSALEARLHRLGGDAKNWTVVSSDGAVQAAARHARAKILSAQDFARLLAESARGGTRRGPRDAFQSDDQLTDEEVQHWLDEFSRRP